MSYVAPNITQAGTPVDNVKLFGRAVLFCIFDSSGEEAIPPVLCVWVVQAYQDLGCCNGLVEGTNPIQRKPITVTGFDMEVIIEILEDDPEFEANQTQGDLRLRNAIQAQEVRLLSSQVQNMRRELCKARNEAVRQISIFKCSLACMSNNISHLASRPTVSNGKRRKLQTTAEQRINKLSAEQSTLPKLGTPEAVQTAGGVRVLGEEVEVEEMAIEGPQGEERQAIVQPPLLVTKLTKCLWTYMISGRSMNLDMAAVSQQRSGLHRRGDRTGSNATREMFSGLGG